MNSLEAWFLLAMTPTLLVGGLAVDAWGGRGGGRDILFAGVLLGCLGLAALGPRTSKSSPVPVLLMLGLAWGLLVPSALSLMAGDPWGTHGRAAALNLGFFCVAVGALIGPFLVEFLKRRMSLNNSMLVLGLVGLVSGFLVMLTDKVNFVVPITAEEVRSLLSEPALWLAAVVGLIALPLESALTVWPRPFLARLGYGEKPINVWLVAFWVVFLAARLTAGLFLPDGHEGWWVLGFFLLVALTMGNMAGAYGHASGWGLLLVGAFQGPIWPSFLGLVLSLFPGHPFTATAIVYAAGTLGCLLSLPFLGSFVRGHSMRTSFAVFLGLNLAMAAPLLVLALMKS